MNNLMKKFRFALVPLLAVLQIAILGPGGASALTLTNLKVKILAINDFHGQLSPKLVGSRNAGGAAVLASYLKEAEKGMEDRTVIISDGDFVGASPANSALLQDEPSIQFLNTLANSYCLPNKMDPRCNIVATVGNHEFDEGVTELQRMMNGGNYPGNPPGTNAGPFLETPYTGAHFPYVAANVIVTATGKTLLPPYVIKTVRNVPIAFIGVILKDTPNIVAPAGVAGLQFTDEVTAINSYIPEIKKRGVKAIVAVIHQGGGQTGAVISGDIMSIVSKLDSEVDVVISGHSHTNINGTFRHDDGKVALVTQAYSAGTAFANIDLELDPVTKDIVKKSAVITTTYNDVLPGATPDAVVTGIVAAADAKVAPLVNVTIGYVTSSITSTQNAAGESALGNLIADAQRWYEGTDFAFMNPGGIRNNITYNAGVSGAVSWGDLFSVQPFGNQMVTMNMTGQQIYDLLAQQWNSSTAKMLQISGLSYSWGLDPTTSKGVIIEVSKNGILIDKAATYTVTTNNFLAGGGDGFTVFKSGLNSVIGAADINVLVAYIKGLTQPFSAVVDGRIIKTILNVTPVAVAKFAVFSDPHLYDGTTLGASSPEFAQYVAQDRKMISDSNEILTSVITDLNTRPLDFVLVTGDLTKDGELADHQLMATKLGVLKAAGKKVFVIPGNHDINNPDALSFLNSPPVPVPTVTPAEFAQIYADFGYSTALYRDPNSLSYIAEPVAGVWLFALDSCRYANNLNQGYPTTAGSLSSATQSWILDHLAAAKALGKKVIGMEHHGILEHFTGQSVSFPDYVLQDWQNVAKKLSDNGLNVMFTGHYHANDVTLRDFTTSVLHDVETGSTVTSPSPYRTVDFDVTNKTLAIQTQHVTNTASHPSDFAAYAQDYLQTGMTGIVGYQLSHAPYNLTGPALSYITGLVVPAFMAHYAGDESPDPTTKATYMGMMGSSDPITKGLGQSLYALWTDLLPADNNLTITIGSK